MNLQLSYLVRLQQLDLKLHDLEQQRQQIPQRLHAAQAQVEQAQTRLKDVEVSLETLTAERRSGEQDLNEHDSRVAKMRERLGELKTNKEYQAHLFEIEIINKKKSAMEDTILQVMEQSEAKDKELEDAGAQAQELTRTLEKEQGELEALDAQLAREIEHTEQEKTTLRDSLEARLWRRYSTLKASMKLVVVAPVHGGTCQGCQLQIPPQLVASVQRTDELVSCPYCHCILYDEDSLAAAATTAATDPGAEQPDARDALAPERING